MTYKNIKLASMKSKNKYITFYEVVSKKFTHSNGKYLSLRISDYDIAGLLAVIKGRKDYRRLVMDYVGSMDSHGRPYGIFERLIYDGKKGWHYIAGQDEVSEMNIIREILRG